MRKGHCVERAGARRGLQAANSVRKGGFVFLNLIGFSLYEVHQDSCILHYEVYL